MFELILSFGLTFVVCIWLSKQLGKISAAGRQEERAAKDKAIEAESASGIPGDLHSYSGDECRADRPQHLTVADQTASVAFNEGKVQLYWYRSENRCRMVFLPTAKFLVSKYGRRFEIGECQISSATSDEQLKIQARELALSFIKDEIEGKRQERLTRALTDAAPDFDPVVEPQSPPLQTNANPAPESKQEEGAQYPYVIGLLNDFGTAAFPHAKQGRGSDSFYVELKSKSKTFRMWGADLQRCINETGAKVGKRVKIVKLGKQPVMVATKDGQREGLKNLFEMTVLG